MNKIFLDSNILIYLYSADELDRINKIQDMLKKYQHIIISTQVLFEFSYTMSRKFKRDCSDIEKSLEEFRRSFDIAIISYDTLRNALKIVSKYRYSFPDSLIIATAVEYDCDILFSEDMHNDQMIEGGLKIINPFK